MYLSGLRNLVPELEHSLPSQVLASGHFSLLQAKEKEVKMPFLNEVFSHVAEVSKSTQKNRRDFTKIISRYYATTEPAESTVFKPRSVPRALRQFVPQTALFEGGASGFTSKLSKTTVEGIKETAALKSQELASTGIRLANNLEIGVEVCNNLVQ